VYHGEAANARRRSRIAFSPGAARARPRPFRLVFHAPGQRILPLRRARLTSSYRAQQQYAWTPSATAMPKATTIAKVAAVETTTAPARTAVAATTLTIARRSPRRLTIVRPAHEHPNVPYAPVAPRDCDTPRSAGFVSLGSAWIVFPSATAPPS